jgi:hypothetical protein
MVTPPTVKPPPGSSGGKSSGALAPGYQSLVPSSIIAETPMAVISGASRGALRKGR